MKAITSKLLENETIAAALAGAVGIALWAAFAAAIASRYQMPVWS